MKESAIKGMKPPARDNRRIRIKYVKAVETRPTSSQKHDAVSTVSAMRPSKKCTVSCNNLVVGLRVIPSTIRWAQRLATIVYPLRKVPVFIALTRLHMKERRDLCFRYL